MTTRGRGVAFLGVVSAAVALAGVAAFACTNLATLNVSRAAGNPGDVVAVTGSSFAVAKEGAAPSPVQLRWNGMAGPVLAEAVPDTAGNISATFSVPEAKPGQHVLEATQLDAEGEPEFGTPARASFQVLGPSGAAAPPVSEQPAGTGSEPSSAGVAALMVTLGVLGLGLFALGAASFARELRRRELPAAERVSQG